MRVRITRARHGEIDGFQLAQLEVGIAYHLPTTIAGYLVLTKSAEVVDEVEPDRPDTMLFCGVPPPPDVVEDDGLDEDFLEVFERVCDTSIALHSDATVSIRVPARDGGKIKLPTPAEP